MSLTRLKLSMSSMISPSSWPKRRVRSTSAVMTSWKRRWLNRPVSSSVTAWRWTCSCRSTFSIEIAAWLVRYSNSSRWRSENGRPGRAIEITPSTPSSGSGAASGRASAFAPEICVSAASPASSAAASAAYTAAM